VFWGGGGGGGGGEHSRPGALVEKNQRHLSSQTSNSPRETIKFQGKGGGNGVKCPGLRKGSMLGEPKPHSGKRHVEKTKKITKKVCYTTKKSKKDENVSRSGF